MNDTKSRILQTTEKLFFDRGLENMSLRAIAAEAEVNVAAINYHFGSKDNLILEIFARSIESFEKIRDELFREAKENNGSENLTVQDLVRGYYLPWVRSKARYPHSLKHLFRFFSGRSDNSKSFYGNAIREMGKKGYEQFSQGVFEALPDIDREVLKIRINLVATMAATYVMNEWFVERLEEISESNMNQERLVDHMVGIIERGSID